MTTGQLLYAIADTLANANWQRTGKKTGKPKPLAERLRTQAEAASRAEAAAELGESDEFAKIATYLAQFDPAYTGDIIIAPGPENEPREVKPPND